MSNFYNIDTSILLEKTSLVKLIWNFFRDPSGEFSISSCHRVIWHVNKDDWVILKNSMKSDSLSASEKSRRIDLFSTPAITYIAYDVNEFKIKWKIYKIK